ncbi:porin family protein [Foetidibacter luteolus]|uniref:porin family protein n=1 Tax=Foetidibacter luteolus TaxID=2608880 RepID=UPI00129B49C2|nr:porin family protein [Foetidibacter luteolus]
MKKLTAVVVAAFCILSTARSQEAEPGTIELGIGTGYNLSSVMISNNQTNSAYRGSFNASFSADYYFSDRWSIKGKIIYDQKGWNEGFIDIDSVGYATTNYRLNYITIPVMANWHFGRTRNWYLNFGPYAGFLLSAKETSLNTNLKNYMKGTDFGLAFGIGVKFPISENTRLGLEYDGQSGVTDIIKNNSGTSIRNIRSSFNVGLHFMLN